ncbi:MAG: aminotransferase class I/II-fold pyridoxal phosphate-dependent enzyme [Clostridia bacterium]|nr:aminotransferase class I/II-fold pyridoxal phosphate-dependent enzyme [Clostridia bacterium]
MEFSLMSKAELKELHDSLSCEYNAYKNSGLKLDLSRGKPNKEQLDLSNELLVSEATEEYYLDENGFDCRNYGLGDGTSEMKRIFSDIFNIPEKNIIVGGNSSLNMMFDNIARLLLRGTCGHEPWVKQGQIKFICPAPGYDRHFSVLETLGIELLTVEMLSDGPDMDKVERLAKDPLVKGLICVPKYSNPTGITFSENCVRRLASMDAAPDFRIIWDNAYGIHDFNSKPDELPDVFKISAEYGNEDRFLYFSSTSKITFPGGGIAMAAASDSNIDEMRKYMSMQTIGYDKLNQLRHAKYIKNKENAARIMARHAEILNPRFELCKKILHEGLDGLGIADWYDPNGGYFISLNVLDGCAKRVWTLMKECGVNMTGAGATYPYKKDPRDRNLRLAPTYSTIEDLETTLKILVCCVKLAAAEKLLA